MSHLAVDKHGEVLHTTMESWMTSKNGDTDDDDDDVVGISREIGHRASVMEMHGIEDVEMSTLGATSSQVVRERVWP